MTDSTSRQLRWTTFSLVVAAFVPPLLSHPGRIAADTKVHLYLDPFRLISDSIWTWDTRLFSGWVPHQNVGYLWPSGPFYALGQWIGLTDWSVQRLWMGMLFALAGIGAARLIRSLGVTGIAVAVAALTYQFSPYVLPYISRTSVLLLPWSLLPWLIDYSLRYTRDRRPRDLLIFGLLIASSGGLNATALIVLAPAPVIWILALRFRREISPAQALRSILVLGITAASMSAWWLAGLAVQGRYGASVLSYSEALESTSATSSAPEVLRGLGYWLFYDRNAIVSLTTASHPYQGSIPVMSAGFVLILLGLLGIIHSGTWRRPLSVMLLTGTVLSVGAYPFSDSSLLFRPLVTHPQNALSLALRSSTRAAPMICLALTIGIAFLLDRVRSMERISSRRFRAAAAAIVVLTVVNFPAAIDGDLTDRDLLRPESVPGPWIDLSHFLDQRFDSGKTGAVLIVPGIESAAYRWGYTVDQMLPSLTKKPVLTRDWLPLGSPVLMDLLYALDDSYQDGTADPAALAPIARLLGADTVVFVSSHQYERFGTIRPSRSVTMFDPVPTGLDLVATFGSPTPNLASRPTWSEEMVAYPDRSLPELTVFDVTDSTSPTSSFSDASVVAGDGAGLVDLASMGAIDGHDLLFAEASLDDTMLERLASAANSWYITDGNRDRAHHWRSSQEVHGATEPPGGVLLADDHFDSRLPTFPEQQSRSLSSIEPAPVEATASAYGAELTYQPEFRPRLAVDGDPRTAWRIGPDRSPVGHILRIASKQPLPTLHLLQPQDADPRQRITSVSVRVDGDDWISYPVDSDSWTMPGQAISLVHPGNVIEIRIDSIDTSGRFLSSLGVGFAEVISADLTSPEIVVMPSRLVPSDGESATFSMSRLRADPFDRWRDDPEVALARRLTTERTDVRHLAFQVRLSARASDDTLKTALGIDAPSSTAHLHGSARWWGPSAFDGDPGTSWISPVDIDTRANKVWSFTIDLRQPLRWIELHQPMTGQFSRVSRLKIHAVGRDGAIHEVVLPVSPPDGIGRSRVDVPEIDAIAATVTIDEVDAVDVLDQHTRRTVVAPVAISELTSNAWQQTFSSTSFDSGCRHDLLTIAGQPIGIRIRGLLVDALAARALDAQWCDETDLQLTGSVDIVSRPGLDTGWDLDRLEIDTGPVPNPSLPATVIDASATRTTRSFPAPRCATSCWVQTGDGYSSGWSASIDGRSLNGPIPSASGRNVWNVTNRDSGSRATVTWIPQRWIWIGFTLTGLTLMVLTVSSLRSRRKITRITSSGATLPDRSDPSIQLVATYGFIGGVVVVSPMWGVLIAVSIVVLARFKRFLPLLGVASIGLGYLYVVVQQIRSGAQPGFAWPSTFARAHRPMLAALIVYCLSLTIESVSSPRVSEAADLAE